MTGFQPQALVFDVDGVLRVGEEALPGAPELLRALEDRGFPYHIITNHPFLDREKKARHLRSLGLDVDPERLSGAADPLGDLLPSLRLRTRRVYAVSDEDTPAFLARFGLVQDNDAGARDLGAVILFDDDLGWNMARITHVFNLLLDDPSLPLVVANPDRIFPLPGGRFMPGSGAVAGWITELCGLRGIAVRPVFLGKPHAPLFRAAEAALLARHPLLRRDGIFMVGDNPDTDIAGARRAGWRAVLLDTGNGAAGGAQGAVADLRMRDLRELAAAMGIAA